MFEECLGLLYDMIDYVCDTFGYVWICLEMYENVWKDLHLLGQISLFAHADGGPRDTPTWSPIDKSSDPYDNPFSEFSLMFHQNRFE